MSFNSGDILDVQRSRVTTQDIIDGKAVRTVCRLSESAEDATELLAMLGLDPKTTIKQKESND